MLHSPAELAALQAETGQRTDLDTLVTAVEQRLGALTDALRDRNAPSIELHATELHRDLARAVEAFMHAARHGGVPDPMRLRLARAGAQVARQREALARATAALDRAIDVLMPPPAPHASVYGASGRPEGLLRGGSLSA